LNRRLGVLPLLAVLATAACFLPGAAPQDAAARAAAPVRAPTGAGASAGASAGAGGGTMVALIDEYTADERSVSRFYGIDISETRLARQDALAALWLARLDAVDFDALPREARVDWLLLRNALDSGRRARTARRGTLAETAPRLPFAGTITALEEARWTLQPVDPEQAARTLDALTKTVKTSRESVKPKKKGADKASKDSKPDTDARQDPVEDADAPADDGSGDDGGDEDDGEASVEAASDADADAAEPGQAGPPTPVVARRAAGEVDELRETLATWYRHYETFVPDFAWWTKEPYDAARKELEDYAELLRKDIAGLKGEDDDPLVGDPIGRDALVNDLIGEWIVYTPEELLAIGEREFAWCEARMLEAAAELGHGEDWQAALAAVKENHVAPGEQDALVVRQSQDAIAFLDEHDLVSIPDLCRETWRVRMIDEREQRTLPFAAYGGQDMLVAYPTAAMDVETKLGTMRGNNEHFSRIVVPHELIPGHHLQGYMSGRYRTHRRAFSTPFLGEGWALYWEMRLWDAAYARDAADRAGMLFWRMHRAARIIISLKFHLGEMSPQEMIDFLVERVCHETTGATAEVRRYIGGEYGPLYQCAYMIGGLQLRALRAELVESGRMSDRQFHDAVLQQNSMPVELIRAALTELPLTRDSRASWRFAGDV
jgi:uncharacterized protein (DUF885 family)